MKKRLIFSTLIAAGMFLVKNTASAQTDAPQTATLQTAPAKAGYSKWQFGVNLGYGHAGGDFASTDASKMPVSQFIKGGDTTHIAGYAESGFTGNIYLTYMFIHHLGVMASFNGTWDLYDQGALDANINNLAVSAAPGAITPTTCEVSGNYFVAQYLIGLYGGIPLGRSDRFQLELKALVGATQVTYPSLTYIYYTQPENYATSTTFKNYTGFGYNLGLGFKLMATNSIALHIDAAYAATNVSYPDWYTCDNNDIIVTHPTSLAMSLTLVQVTLGVSFEM